MRNRLENLVPLANTHFRRYRRTREDIIKIEPRGVRCKGEAFSFLITLFNGEDEIKLSSSRKVENFFITSRNAKFTRKPEHHLVINMKKNISCLRSTSGNRYGCRRNPRQHDAAASADVWQNSAVLPLARRHHVIILTFEFQFYLLNSFECQ